MLHKIYSFLFFGGLVCMTGANRVVFNENGDCIIEGFSVMCGRTLPRVLPENITRVTVTELLQNSIDNDTFEHNSWRLVNYLDVTFNKHVNFRLKEYNFYALKNLKSLGLHSSKLTFSDNKNIFQGLLELQTLNLSSCFYLKTAELVLNLQTQKSLHSLILDQVSLFYTGQVVIDNGFIEMISRLKIRKLSLSGCNLLVKGPFYTEGLSFSLNVADFSNITLRERIDNFERRQIITVLSQLKILNISNLPSKFVAFSFWHLTGGRKTAHCYERFSDDFAYLFYKVERLEMNSIISRTVKINNTYMDLSHCSYINLKSLKLRSNNLQYLNATIQSPEKVVNLYEVDLSLNDLEYLSPFLLGSILSLEKLHLAHNKLYRMASLAEFKYLFSAIKNLWYLDLSNNHFSWLPRTTFSNTLNLTFLDLSYNQLSSISFEIMHLIKLRFLNMEYNMVRYIDGTDFRNLKFLLQNKPIPTNISFAHNQIVCSCDSVRFITWLNAYVKTSEMQSYVCSLEGKTIQLDSHAVEESEFLCIRSKIVIVSVSLSISAFCIISLVAAVVIYRKRQQRRAQKNANFLEDFENGLLQQKFLCFLSYSSEDEGNDIHEIYEKLEEALLRTTGLKQEVVCFGDKDFHLGFPIADEIVRCISESCVVVCIVSNNFCESHRCQMELREAYELNKPIILIFKEEVDLTRMQPLMSKIFRRYTRAKLITKEDGRKEIVPGYEQISCSILKLAVSHTETEVI
ncbi:toll-like receptor 4 [Mercenaria mercenaria]|uniref:toll-like receptor 4 n=1 Tax=Mercenaria mercenaria TaxID=6596 RepID=UPI00234EAB80|nr:toll-like receptor 4 [Mercenaria mercenaria]XP_045157006.2 toll-like receptor 4 [Mercenaria mercenaria]